jgi:hypothetical protein
MAVETPTAIWILSLLPEKTLHKAAFLMMGGIANWIESPVIDLLATSTTLARTRESFAAIRRFTIWMIVWVTVAHAIASMTPVYFFITRTLLSVPEEVVQTARIPLMFMLPWSGFIGWRRYLQGIMIREGRTKEIGVGTAVRFASMFSIGFALYLLSGKLNLSGLSVVAIALTTSVAMESMFIHFVSRPVLQKAFYRSPLSGRPLSIGKVSFFHLPLTLATMVTMLSTPLISGALARTQDSVYAMAAWLDGTVITFLLRTITYALNEVVISLSTTPQARRKLFQFSLRVGLSASIVAVFCGLTGVDQLVFRYLLHTDPRLFRSAHLALMAVTLTPTINAVVIYLRGLLTARHVTYARVIAIVASVIALYSSLTIGVLAKWPGVIVAAVAITISLTVELIVLALVWRCSNPRFEMELRKEEPIQLLDEPTEII